MPFDSLMVRALTGELNVMAAGGRVDKIQQPERDQVVLSVYANSKNLRLIIAASGMSPRIYISEEKTENPSAPPMFCMLLRKHLTGARICSFSQPGYERIIIIEFDCINELGEKSKKYLAAEMMGRMANMVLYGEDERIIGCLRRVDFDMSGKRRLMPGMFYRLPPRPDKPDFSDAAMSVLTDIFKEGPPEKEAAKRLGEGLFGLSPLICREVVFRAAKDAAIRQGDLSLQQIQRICDELRVLSDNAEKDLLRPYLLYDALDGKPLDYSVMPIGHYSDLARQQIKSGFSQMISEFYSVRARAESMKKRSADILKAVTTVRSRVARKLEYQRLEHAESKDREMLRRKGDLLMANAHAMAKGMSKVTVSDFYSEGNEEMEITLDMALSPHENAQKYYKDYNRMKNAEVMLVSQIEQGERELVYLESVIHEIESAKSPSELSEISDELADGGYIPSKGRQKKKKQEQTVRPASYRSGEGFVILAGRNNRENDLLTLKAASKSDIWLHAKNIPGSHVIILCGGSEPGDATLTEAAQIAAFHSAASSSSQVPVDYARVRHVKKPQGAKPGMVTYTNYKTAYVTPDEAALDGLRQK